VTQQVLPKSAAQSTANISTSSDEERGRLTVSETTAAYMAYCISLDSHSAHIH